MDGGTKIKLPSMKTAKIMDGRRYRKPRKFHMTFGAYMLLTTA